jgi:hypothetical protein
MPLASQCHSWPHSLSLLLIRGLSILPLTGIKQLPLVQLVALTCDLQFANVMMIYFSLACTSHAIIVPMPLIRYELPVPLKPRSSQSQLPTHSMLLDLHRCTCSRILISLHCSGSRGASSVHRDPSTTAGAYSMHAKEMSTSATNASGMHRGTFTRNSQSL